jgi:hypothetical protein
MNSYDKELFLILINKFKNFGVTKGGNNKKRTAKRGNKVTTKLQNEGTIKRGNGKTRE